ncbi:MAG: hypothetical protein KDB69_06535 [Acidimicrobiia bacterium]|nr:hypothetical protein [Acidimicrobiia bacterium]
MLSPDDDRFHPITRDADTWTETCWFAAHVPERGMGIWTYPLFRPGLEIMACGVYVWDFESSELWQLPYYRTYWHMRFPRDCDLDHLRLENGLSYDVIEPLTTYHVGYSDGDALSIDLEFDAIHDPHPLMGKEGVGHFDQLGRVTGEIVLYGETIEVDCIEMRDRTWGPRRERKQQTILAYDYGARSETSGFHCSSLFDRERSAYRLLTGFVLTEDGKFDLADATRHIERDPGGRPTHIRVEGHIENGEPFTVTGEVISRFGKPSTPWFNWVSLVKWTLPDGSEAFGEDQETWSPERLREMRAT